MTIDKKTGRSITPWHETYRQLIESVGKRGPALRKCLIGLVLAAAFQGLALGCIVPLFIAVFDKPDFAMAIVWLTAMSVLMIASTVFRWQAQGFDYDGSMAEATHELRTLLGEQLRRMPLEIIQDRRAGEMNATLLGNVDENLNYSLFIINLILVALVTPFATALLLMLFDWRLGIALMFIFPAIIPLYRWRRPVFADTMRVLAEAHERISADIVEYTQGILVLRSACGAGRKAASLQEGFRLLEGAQTTAQKRGAKPNLMVASVVETGLLLIFLAGIYWVLGGTLNIAILAAVFVIVVRFAEPLANFINYTVILELIETALERIKALLSVSPLPMTEPARRPETYDVVFERVTFRYAQAKTPSVMGFSALLPSRSFTALVGPSGSGKTTLTRLLLRHADPQEGKVLIGGIDIRSIPSDELNSMISVVFQDVYLFDDTVLANVRMACPDASDADVEEALRAAQCLEFIDRLPQGLQTPLGDIGGRLSGGERQRISIARALLKNAPIVILDEPTAALDTESELAVQRAIDALVKDRTVIVIAHRLSTIVGADRILVMDNARLVEMGTHSELIAAGGKYRSMWNAQQSVKAWHVGSIASGSS